VGFVARVPASCRAGVLAAVAGFLAGPVARAQSGAAPSAPSNTTEFSLVWSAPEECPKEAALRAEVLRLAPEAASGVPGFSARGTVSRSDAGFGLELETLYGERRGSRHMQDVSCTELTRAAAVVIALAIRPESASGDGTPVATEDATNKPENPPNETTAADANAQGKAEATATAHEAPPAAKPAPKPDEPATTGARPFELWVGASAAAEVGTLPGFAPGVTFGVEGRTKWLRVALSAEFLPSQESSPDAPGDPVVAVNYFGGDAVGCLGLLEQRFAPGVCAGFGVGRLSGASPDAPIPGEGSTIWVTPRLGAFGLYRVLPILSLEVGAHARFATKEASFQIEGLGPVFETAPVALLLTAGASLRIW